MYRQVLIPTDGSEHATRAAKHGLWLAEAFDASVDVLSVVDTHHVVGPFDAGGLDEVEFEQLEADRRELLEDVDELAPTGLRVGKSVRKGRPADQILGHAEDIDADVIAMGTRGRRGLERYLVGSVAEAVLRQSSIPVFTAKADGENGSVAGYSDVLVPTDGSETAETAVEHALAIAGHSDATVHVLSVVDTQAMASGFDLGVGLPSILERLTDLRHEAVDTIGEKVREAGLDCETAIVEGPPTKSIRTYATENGVDLIVMGTHGNSGLERLLLGSVAERTIRTAGQPVLAVPPEDG